MHLIASHRHAPGQPTPFQPPLRYYTRPTPRGREGMLIPSPALWERLSYVVLVGFLCVSTLCQNFTGISPECHKNSPEIHQNVTGMSPEFRLNIESEHLEQGDKTTPQPSHTPCRSRNSEAGGARREELPQLPTDVGLLTAPDVEGCCCCCCCLLICASCVCCCCGRGGQLLILLFVNMCMMCLLWLFGGWHAAERYGQSPY